MKNTLIEQLENVLPKKIKLPYELKLLYQWIEENNFYKDNKNGLRYGFLFSDKELQESCTENGREGGTNIEFFASGVDNLKYWFGGNDNEEIKSRLCVFGQSGYDGSEVALWLSENEEVKIVHLGSGSGSILSCVLAENFIDFIRLLAIGYDEICWAEDFSYLPNEKNKDFFVKPNVQFQNWVKQTFEVEIPKTALEIVKYPATLLDKNSKDEFFNWYQKY